MKQLTYVGAVALLLWGCGDDSGTEPPEPTSLDMSVPVEELEVDQTTSAEATVLDQDGEAMTGLAITWTSSDDAVATVSSAGLITGVSSGDVTVTATSGSLSASEDLTVVPVPPMATEVDVSAPSNEVAVGETVTATTVVRDQYGEEMAGAMVDWSSSDPERATVSDEGVIAGVSEGDVTVTATSGEASGTLELVVTPAPVSSVAIEEQPMVLRVDREAQLHAVVRDAAGNPLEGRLVEWSSSSPAHATVDAEGLVTAIAEGAAVITSTSEGESASVAVTVDPADASTYLAALAELQDSVFAAVADSPMWWAYTVDIGGDGYLDLVVEHGEDAGGVLTKYPLLLFRNVENERFEKVETGIPAWGRIIVVDDFTGDGLEDLFFADHGEETTEPWPERTLGSNQLLVQDGGAFRETTAIALPDTLAYSHGACSGDLNGDGAPDLVVNMLNTEQVLINDGSGTFTPEDFITPNLDESGASDVENPIQIQSWACGMGDFRNQGYDDVILSSDGYEVPADYGDGAPNPFQAVDPFGNALPQSAKFLFNNGGTEVEYRYPESIVVSPWSGSGTAAVGLNTLTYDFDRDGCLDMSVYSTDYVNAHKAEIYLGDCAGGFSDPQVLDLPSVDYLWEDIALADVNGDSWVDIVYSNNMADTWMWGGGNRSDMHVILINDGGTFTLRQGEPSDAAFIPPHAAVSWVLP